MLFTNFTSINSIWCYIMTWTKALWITNRKQSFYKRIGPCIDFCILHKSHIYICLKPSLCVGEILPNKKIENLKLKNEMICEGEN